MHQPTDSTSVVQRQTTRQMRIRPQIDTAQGATEGFTKIYFTHERNR